MNTNRLSEKIAKALNDQMTREALASQTYLSYATWADDQGYDGIANFLYRHAHEERNHMMKFLEYVQERGARCHITAIPAPDGDPTSVNDCFEKVFQQEVGNTEAIYNLVNLSLEQKDWATWNFLQYFVKEQVEEETMAMNMLNKIKIAGGANAKAKDSVLYSLDRDLGTTPDDAKLAQDATVEKP
jgi:ferritin